MKRGIDVPARQHHHRILDRRNLAGHQRGQRDGTAGLDHQLMKCVDDYLDMRLATDPVKPAIPYRSSRS